MALWQKGLSPPCPPLSPSLSLYLSVDWADGGSSSSSLCRLLDILATVTIQNGGLTTLGEYWLEPLSSFTV